MVASADEYTIVRQGETSTVYTIVEDSNGNSFTRSAVMTVSPSINQLQAINLPSYLWEYFDETDGIYDTRLMRAVANEATVKYEFEETQIQVKDLTSTKNLLIVALLVLAAVASIVLAYLTRRVNYLSQLKQVQA